MPRRTLDARTCSRNGPPCESVQKPKRTSGERALGHTKSLMSLMVARNKRRHWRGRHIQQAKVA